MYVSSGSALAVLDTLFFGAELAMTDLDLNVHAPNCLAERDFAQVMNHVLQQSQLTPVKDSFREMRRVVRTGDIDSPLEVVGYRAFARHPDLRPLIDISLFRSLPALEQNGYLNTQLVKISLPKADTFSSVCEELHAIGFQRSC